MLIPPSDPAWAASLRPSTLQDAHGGVRIQTCIPHRGVVLRLEQMFWRCGMRHAQSERDTLELYRDAAR
jgi:hypothetical protein